MVEDFKNRHRAGKVPVDAVRLFAMLAPKLAGYYGRYSCDNSSPTSLFDQMNKSLDKARQEDRFIPWSYVFCDYSVTGLDPSRQGYSSYKAVLADENHLTQKLLIAPRRVEWTRQRYWLMRN